MATALKILEKQQKDWLHNLAFIYLQHGMYQSARELWESVLEFSPYDRKVLLALAFCALKAQEWQECLAWVSRYEVAGHTNDDSGIHLIKGKALWGLEKCNEARVLGQQFLERKKTSET